MKQPLIARTIVASALFFLGTFAAGAGEGRPLGDIGTELLKLDCKKGLSLLAFSQLTERAPLQATTGAFAAGRAVRQMEGRDLYRRVTTGISDDGTVVTVIDPVSKEEREMLNFASNS